MVRLAVACLLLLVSGCTIPLGGPPQSAQDRQILSDCQHDADRQYDAQNRADLSTRSTIDTPYSSNGLPGVTSEGLSGRYARDQLVKSCLRQNQGLTPGNVGGIDASPQDPHTAVR